MDIQHVSCSSFSVSLQSNSRQPITNIKPLTGSIPSLTIFLESGLVLTCVHSTYKHSVT